MVDHGRKKIPQARLRAGRGRPRRRPDLSPGSASVLLPESGRLLQLVLDTIPARVFWKDRNLVYLGCNRLCALDAGLESPEQIIGKNDFELGWREQATQYRMDDRSVIETGQPKLDYQEPQRTPDGRLIRLRTSKIPLRDSQGDIVGVMGVYQEVTEQRLAQDALRESEVRFRTLVDLLPLGVEEADLQGIIQFSNLAHHKILGYSPGELIGKNILELSASSPEATRNLLRKITTEQLEPQPVYDKQRTQDGRVIDVRRDWNYLRDAEGRPIGLVSLITDISESKRMEAYLKHIATHDPLTDLPNRAYLYEHLRHAITLARRNQYTLAVLYLDIDGFKSVNDSFGHPTGDLLLWRISKRFRRNIRQSDLVARLGGDEFAFVLERVKQPEDAGLVAEKILRVLARPFRLQGAEIQITGSIGISFYPEHGGKPATLVRKADQAMYQAKRAGKNRYQQAGGEG